MKSGMVEEIPEPFRLVFSGGERDKAALSPSVVEDVARVLGRGVDALGQVPRRPEPCAAWHQGVHLSPSKLVDRVDICQI